MKVLLISTPWDNNPAFSPPTDDESNYPLGLAYLKSYLESKGHEVCLEWLNNYPDIWLTVLSITLVPQSPDVVGFNMLTINRVSTYKGIEYIHENFPNIKIVLGGIHATLMYRQILKKYPYVIVVRGEGEITFGEILEGKPLKDIAGIAYYNGDDIATNSDRKLIENLDTLPFPDHTIFFEGTRTFANILTSRGCPNNCSFCCLNPISKHTVRFRSVENVISEVEYLIQTFPQIDTIWIQDDSFFLNNNRVIRFCNEIIKRNIHIEFCCAGRVKPLSEETVLKLEEAGFKEVQLGLESGDAGVLAGCNKGITLGDVTKAVQLFATTDIVLTLYVIVGLPGETEQSILNTARFIQELQRIKYIHFWSVGTLMVFPGTEVYELSKKAGTIDDDYWLTDLSVPYYIVDNPQGVTDRYRDILLSYIKMEKIFTLSGFIHQFFMIPHILRYNLKYNSRMKRLR